MRFVAAFVCALLTFVCSSPGHADKRVALVVGNGGYENAAALPNPVNDANDMAAALRELGFEVIVETNANKHGLETALARFGRLAQNADAALFYYAGHGIQYRGRNYLVPVDARLEDEFSVNYELTRIDDVLFAVSQASGVKLLILDACRNNPLADRLVRSTSRNTGITRGLTLIDDARGMIVAYATQPNQVADDGHGRNSPFTSALLNEMKEPGLEIATFFRRVAADVDHATNGRQFPELSISMTGEFYLNNRETDAQAWIRVRQSSDAVELQDFLRRYPQSFLVTDARARLSTLERERAARELAERQASEQAIRIDAERRIREQTVRDKAEQEAAVRQAADPQSTAAQGGNSSKGADGERAEGDRTAQDEAEQAKVVPPMALLTLPPDPQKILSPPDLAVSRGALIIEIKKELKRVGCYTGREDDKWSTPDTKASVQKFMAYANFASSTEEPTESFLDAVRSKSNRVCPLECGAREVARNGQCVAKSCASGFLIGLDGNCEPPNERAKSAPRVPERPLVSKPNRKPLESHAALPQEAAPARSSEPHIRTPESHTPPLDSSGRISIYHTGTLAREPPPRTLHRNQVVHVDDHTCPGGQVKYVMAGVIGRQPRTTWCGPHP
jgi:Caspase domain